MGELAVIYSLITDFNTSLRGGGVTQKVLASLRTTLVMVLCSISSLFSPLACANVWVWVVLWLEGDGRRLFSVLPGDVCLGSSEDSG